MSASHPSRLEVSADIAIFLSGEDPYLGFRMVAAMVAGIQSQGVIATVKHYANNNQETNRGAVSENVDERTQFEIYYPPFEGSVEVRFDEFWLQFREL